MERTLNKNEKAYKNLVAVAKMLEACNPNEMTYKVEEVYFDFGQDWMWTTIIEYGGQSVFTRIGVQAINPREWREITLAETPAELAACAEAILNKNVF